MAQMPDTVTVHPRLINLPDVQGLTPPEVLGVLVATVLQDTQDERDTARRWAVALENDLAEAKAHLTEVLAEFPPTSWAGTARIVGAAQDFLDRDRVPEDDTVAPEGQEGPQEATT